MDSEKIPTFIKWDMKKYLSISKCMIIIQHYNTANSYSDFIHGSIYWVYDPGRTPHGWCKYLAFNIVKWCFRYTSSLMLGQNSCSIITMHVHLLRCVYQLARCVTPSCILDCCVGLSTETTSNGFTVDNTSAVEKSRISLNRHFGSLKPNTQVVFMTVHGVATVGLLLTIKMIIVFHLRRHDAISSNKKYDHFNS